MDNNNKIYGNDILNSELLGMNTLKKLQEELNSNKRKQVNLIDMKLSRAKAARDDKREKMKAADLFAVKETLNSIYKEYHEKMSTKKISTLEEFAGILLVGLALYDALDSKSLEGKKDEVSEYKKLLDDYKKVKSKIEKYERYSKKYASEKEIEDFEIERKELLVQSRELEKKLNDFTITFFSEVFRDYQNFKQFLKEDDTKEDKRAVTLKTLAELSTLDSYVTRLPEDENEINIYEKLENYKNEFQEILIPSVEDKESANETLMDRLDDIMNAIENNGNIINVAIHLLWANVLLKHNIMRFPAIAEDYSDLKIVKEIKALRNTVLTYYAGDENGDLSYVNEVPVKIKKKSDFSSNRLFEKANAINGIGRQEEEFEKKGTRRKFEPEVVEKHFDDLFYDLLILNHNKYLEANGKLEGILQTKTFQDLKSDKPYLNINGTDKVFGNIFFNEENGTVNMTCTLEDFCFISNALQAIEVLQKDGSYKNVVNFFQSDSEWYQNNKYKLKERFAGDINNYIMVSDEVIEIKENLEKGKYETAEEKENEFKLSFLDIRALYYLLISFNTEENAERNNAGFLLSRRNFFNKTVRKMMKIEVKSLESEIEEAQKEFDEETGEQFIEVNDDFEKGVLGEKREDIASLEKMEKKEKIKDDIIEREYLNMQNNIVNSIKGLIQKILNLSKIMKDLKVEELNGFEKVVNNIKDFDFEKNEKLKENKVYKNVEGIKRLEDHKKAQEEIIRAIYGETL